ncbi:hypothetical protein MKQ70_31435 [Chitinophaga sedimenti]|uniref:hypothetical protein n=1 Tax=Chitinophaga sedimenti TaxID=2033606 RepID=UPI0020056BF0|nr:hypothetical protein [Chitinophaga sedimenti]MCK7559238.1 hypothetical protein [Chitinophaga sedimenti]
MPVAKQPILVFLMKIAQGLKGISGLAAYTGYGTGGQYGFILAVGKLVCVAVQKTTNVEPVTPAQHLSFKFGQVVYGKFMERPDILAI